MTTRAAISADEEEVRKALDLLLDPGDVVELRALDVPQGRNGYRFTASGYFDDRERLVEEAVKLSEGAKGVYVTLNPVSSDLLARACNRTRQMGRGDSSTSDSDIPRRKWFGVDCDPCRPSGISSTGSELTAARERAIAIWSALLDIGFPDPAVYASSGNGGHLVYPVDLPADDGGLLKRCLEALAFVFDDDAVKVDTSVCNPSRIWKLYGTPVRKGDDVPDRPHRVAGILFTPPERPDPVPVSALEQLAGWLPTEDAQPMRTSVSRGFDIDRWIVEHAVPVGEPRQWQGGRRWLFPVCPWNPEHRPDKAFIVQFASGAIGGGCLHAECRHRKWQDIRKLYEPDAYDRERWDPMPVQEQGEPGADRIIPATLTHKDLVTGELPPVQWLVEDIMPKGGLCLLAGDSGVGKSWIGFHLGQSVAAGLPFLGRFATEQGAVLYLDAESGENLIRRRMSKLWNGLEDADRGDGPDIPLGVLLSAVNLDTGGKGLQALEDRISSESLSLVIIDPMIHFGTFDENDSRSMSSFLEGIRAVARATGTTFLLCHHVRKESRLASNAAGQMVRGSTAIKGCVDSLLYLRKLSDGKLQVEHDKLKQADELPRFLVEVTDPDEQTTRIAYLGESGTTETRRELAAEAILRTVADMGGTAKRQMIIEQCTAEGVSKRTVADVLKDMTEGGRLVKAQHGKEVLFSLPEVSGNATQTLAEDW